MSSKFALSDIVIELGNTKMTFSVNSMNVAVAKEIVQETNTGISGVLDLPFRTITLNDYHAVIIVSFDAPELHLTELRIKLGIDKPKWINGSLQNV